MELGMENENNVLTTTSGVTLAVTCPIFVAPISDWLLDISQSEMAGYFATLRGGATICHPNTKSPHIYGGAGGGLYRRHQYKTLRVGKRRSSRQPLHAVGIDRLVERNAPPPHPPSFLFHRAGGGKGKGDIP